MKVRIPLIYEREPFIASEEPLPAGRKLVLIGGELLPAGFKTLLASEKPKEPNTHKEMNTNLLPHFDIVPPAIPS
ncbi:MAG: hypothetical protein HY840_10215, partial [Bacteroidetes bacterium]|nr:hypothetical protein [Bacteroidota bacterium]